MKNKLNFNFIFLSPIKNIFITILLIVLYDIFILKSPYKFFLSIIGGRYFVNYFLSLIILTALVLLGRSLSQKNIVGKIVGAVIVLLPLALQIIHYSFYNVPINAYGIRFFFREPRLSLQLDS